MVTVQGVAVKADTEKGLAYGAGGEVEAKPDTTHGIDVAADSNVHCGRMAVIQRGRHGYRFAKGVTARLIGDEAPHEAREARREAPAEPDREARECDREAPHGPPGEPSLNERHKWIVAEYLAGRRPTRRAIEKATNCSRATAARDLRALRSLGMLKDGQRRQGQRARAQASPP